MTKTGGFPVRGLDVLICNNYNVHGVEGNGPPNMIGMNVGQYDGIAGAIGSTCF